MALQQIVKDPSADLDFTIDLSGEGWLATGETVASVSATAETGLTVENEQAVNDDTGVLVWLVGGTHGGRYLVAIHWVTSDGREDTRRILVKVWNR